MEKLAAGYRTDLERRVEEILLSFGVPYRFERRFGRFWVDFHIPFTGSAIECDGERWHSDPERQRARDAYLRDRFGLRVFHITGRQIKADAVGAVLPAIL